MSITSAYFFAFIIVGIMLYYLIPPRIQWAFLLVFSVVFYCLAAKPYTISYIVVSTLIAYLSTLWISICRKRKQKSKVLVIVFFSSLFVNILFWFLIKGKAFWLPISSILGIRSVPEIISSLGMSYYTLQIMSYIIDCYWETITPQKNPFKLFLFVAYFPQLTTGPISRYSELGSLYQPHLFSYENICFGCQRILWGLFKKMVLTERISALVSGILASPKEFNGFYSWIVILIYPLQLYADFSGCMDIVLGVSQLFGIVLPENFNNPFFARNSQEFWQRWHITLGTWAKDYVLFPILKSKPIVRMAKKLKMRVGRARANFITNCLGMFFLWVAMGVWHGGYRYIVGVSLWYWMVLMIGNLITPICKRTNVALGIKDKAFSWHLFQSIRTYLIFSIGAVFFWRGIKEGALLIKDCLRVVYVKGYANPWIFYDDSVLNIGVTYHDLNIVITGIALLVIVGFLREKYGSARIWIAQQNIGFRWFIWVTLFVSVLILGRYGPGYDASIFIYQYF